MKEGVEPVVAPLKKQTCKKSGLRPFAEQDMCPEVRKRRVSRPSRGMATSGSTSRENFSLGDLQRDFLGESEPDMVPCPDPDPKLDESLDSNASDVEKYLHEPMKEYHPVFTPPETDSEEESGPSGAG